MSKVCEYCGKHPQTGNTVSHAHNLNKRRFMFNIQRLKALIHGSVKFIYVCTKCIKRGRVVRPTARSYTRSA